MKKYVLVICILLCVIMIGCTGPKGDQGIQGEEGKSAYELAVENGYKGDLNTWLASLKGPQGDKGSQVLMKVANGYIQWKYENEEEWQKLISLEELTGEKGEQGVQGDQGIQGPQGEKGEEVLIQVANGYIQWKYENEEEWQKLISLEELTGEKGDQGIQGPQGEKGKEVEMQLANGYIQWKYTDDETWQDLILVKDLIGEKGDKGDQGIQGPQGEKGDKGDPGIYITGVSSDYKGNVKIYLSDGTSYEISVKDIACEHNFSTYDVYPTCLEEGYTVYTCLICGYSYHNDFVPSSGHHYADNSCVYCGSDEPFGAISVNTSWYNSSLKDFVITTRNELAGLASLVNNGTSFSGCTISLGANIDLGYAEWVPIGTATNPFAGTFDGKNFIINRLKVTTLDSYIGLFGNVSGYISNFNITNANIRDEYVGNYIGIACGYATNNISGITTSGYIDADRSLYVGGIVGYSTSYIDKCENSADIIGKNYVGGIAGYTGTTKSTPYYNLKNKGNITGDEYTGGIIGRVYSYVSYYSDYSLNINMAYNTGNITGNDYTGGIIGNIYVNNGKDAYSLSIEDLQNTGSITGSLYTGGLIGYGYAKNTSSKIFESSNQSSVIGDAYVGGIAGCLENITIDSCDNGTKDIQATGLSTNDDSQNVVYLGGYVGKGYAVINCINTISLEYLLTADYIGGIAGSLTSTLSDCINNANIVSSKSCLVGGIAGHTNYFITDCENTGDVVGLDKVGGIVGQTGTANSTPYHNLKNTGSITGHDYIGGIFGRVYSYVSYYSDYSLNINMAYNTGSITGNDYTGGIIGYICVSNSREIYSLSIEDLQNTGSVTGSLYTGGLIGYGYATTTSSKIMESKNQSSVIGDAYIGGIAGWLENIIIDSCNNGTQDIQANGSAINDDSQNVVYLGGYVGKGYTVINCTNNIKIEYSLSADFVGGIAGALTSTVDDCINNASVSAPKSNFVAGIAGSINSFISNCENNGDIRGLNNVAGITGYTTTTSSTPYYNLKNSGKILGNDYIAGIISKLYSYVSYYSDYSLNINMAYNTGSITGNDYTGGIIGYIYVNNGRDAYLLMIEDLQNTGSVKGTLYTGGLIGYGYAKTTSSKIFESKNQSSVTGDAYVGGIAGALENICVDSCYNKNSSITALLSTEEDTVTVVYLGGYVGKGYHVANCENSVSLNYQGAGLYVGGIAGFLAAGCDKCQNTASVKGANAVGGITGRSSCLIGAGVYQNLTNSGTITGINFVGGITGYVYDYWGNNSNKTIVMTNIINRGQVSGAEYVGGIFGYMFSYNSDGITYSAAIKVTATIIENYGLIYGDDYVGRIFGYFKSDGASTISSYITYGNTISTGENVDVLAGYSENLN